MKNKPDIRIVNLSRRSVFYRGERVRLRTALMNFEPRNYDDCALTLELPSGTSVTHTLPMLSHHLNPPDFEFETADFPGAWRSALPLILTRPSGGAELARTEIPCEIVPAPDAGEMALWHWPSTVHYDALEADEPSALRELELLHRLGVTWTQFRANWALLHPDDAVKRIESAMRLGIQLGILIENTAGGIFRAEAGDPDSARRVDADGTRSDFLNPNDPHLHEKARFLIRRLHALFGEFPSCSTIFLNSELEDKLKLPCDPSSIRIHESALGFPLSRLRSTERVFAESFPDVPFLRPGVISDDDPELKYARYYFESGDGWTSVNRTLGDTARALRPDWITIADPLRLCPVPERFDGIDLISSWTYTNPDPKLTLFAETLARAAHRTGKDFIHTVTLWNYAGTLTPCGKNRFSREHTLRMGPDRWKECAWINFSRGPRALGNYFGSPIEVFFSGGDPTLFSPSTESAISEFSREVLRPFGSLARRTENVPRRCAVLDSYASRIYGALPRSHAHYPNYQIYDFLTVMNMAQLPADVLFEEDLTEDDALSRYDLLALPAAPVLTERVWKSIRSFAARGGTVIADRSVSADIPGLLRFDFDFSWRRTVNANAICSGADFAIADDTNFRSEWGGTVNVRGVPADEDRNRMEAYASELRRVIDSRFRRAFDCDSLRVLNNLRTDGVHTYLFAVNDNRTWDERSGPYRAMLERGVAQNAVWTFPAESACSRVRELVSNRDIPVTRGTDGSYSFEYELPPAGGAIFALLPCVPESLRLERAERGASSDLFLRTASPAGGGGLRPFRLEIFRPDGSADENGRSGVFRGPSHQVHVPSPAGEMSGEFRAVLLDRLTGKTETLRWSVSKTGEV